MATQRSGSRNGFLVIALVSLGVYGGAKSFAVDIKNGPVHITNAEGGVLINLEIKGVSQA